MVNLLLKKKKDGYENKYFYNDLMLCGKVLKLYSEIYKFFLAWTVEIQEQFK